MTAPGARLLMACGGGGGSALEAAILALSPLSYWTLRGNDADTLNDFGSLGHDLVNFGGGITLDNTAGPDGNYAKAIGSGTKHLDGVDDIAYEPQNASGLTVVFLLAQNDTVGTGVNYQIVKMDGAGAGSWYVYTAENISGSIYVEAGTRTTGTAVARRRRGTTIAATTAWKMYAIRYSGSATGYPTVRVDGTNYTLSTDTTGTAQSNSTQPIYLFGKGDSGSRSVAAMAHVAIFAGQLSDGDLAGIEAAAATDGW